MQLHLHRRDLVDEPKLIIGGCQAIARTVKLYDRAGIAGLHIEDQIQTKRCGHLAGKILVSREVFATRIRAAAAARKEIPGGSDIVIIARTDALQSYSLEESIERVSELNHLFMDVRADLPSIPAARGQRGRSGRRIPRGNRHT